LRLARAASFTCSTAHSWRFAGLPRTSGAAKASSASSNTGLTATHWPWRWVASSVISTPCCAACPFSSSQ
jgi:hypothetical protein